MMEYFCCYHSYARKLVKLSDQEVGRLFRSLLQYSETGGTQELTGRESVAFDFIADDIDRAKKKYEDMCRRNRANATDRKRPQATDSETSQYKTKDKSKTKTESKAKTTTKPTRADAREASSAIAVYLDRVNPSASQQSLDLLAAYERDMGEEVCIRAIDIALDNRKATWAYIRAILQRWSSEGVRCLADIDALEAKHEAQKQSGVKTLPGAGGTAPQPAAPGEADRRARDDMERLREMMRCGEMEE